MLRVGEPGAGEGMHAVSLSHTHTHIHTNSVEDEYHLLTCPAYEHLPHFSNLRLFWDHPDPTTSSPDAIINHRFNPPGHLWRPFATYLNRCLNMRQDLLQILPPNPTSFTNIFSQHLLLPPESVRIPHYSKAATCMVFQAP